MEHIYLQKVDSGTNTQKYWEAAYTGSQYWVHWGRIGTAGQHKFKTLRSPSEASQLFHKMRQEKLSEAYRPTARDEPFDVEEVFNTAVPDNTSVTPISIEDYYLSWSAVGLSDVNITDAYLLTRTILDEASNAFIGCVELKSGYDQHPYVRFEIGNEKFFFGYPPMEFIDNLSRRERLAVEQNGTSRDGWLSMRGTGTGVMVTGKQRIDFPVRLFLTILRAKSADVFTLTDSENNELLSNQFTMPQQIEEFEWHIDWETSLKIPVQNHWFTEGQVAKIRHESAFDF